jgi:hypothetical protein
MIQGGIFILLSHLKDIIGESGVSGGFLAALGRRFGRQEPSRCELAGTKFD